MFEMVFWSNEPPFTLRYQCRRRVLRAKDEKLKYFAMTPAIKHDRKVNVWGCFLYMVEDNSILKKTMLWKTLNIHNQINEWSTPLCLVNT